MFAGASEEYALLVMAHTRRRKDSPFCSTATLVSDILHFGSDVLPPVFDLYRVGSGSGCNVMQVPGMYSVTFFVSNSVGATATRVRHVKV